MPCADPMRVIVGDGQAAGLRAVVAAIRERPELELVGSLSSGPAAVTAIAALRPDVAVLAVPLPGLSRQRLLELAGGSGSSTRFVFVSDDVDGAVIFRALAGGAAGYVGKDIGAAALSDAVLAVALGETVLSASVRSRLALAIRDRDSRHQGITQREREVLALAANGRTTSQIAAGLDIASATVKAHLASIYHKLDVSDRTSAVATAIRRGLLE